MLEQLRAADFAAHLDEIFQAIFSDGRLDLRLIEVSEHGQLGAAPDDGRRRPFSLMFVEPGGRYLPQRIYPLEHPALGRLEIFLVPIGRDQRGLRLEAVFT